MLNRSKIQELIGWLRFADALGGEIKDPARGTFEFDMCNVLVTRAETGPKCSGCALGLALWLGFAPDPSAETIETVFGIEAKDFKRIFFDSGQDENGIQVSIYPNIDYSEVTPGMVADHLEALLRREAKREEN